MGTLMDLTGSKFGRLTVLRKSATIKRQPWWLCECECGATKVIIGRNLRDGKTKSCGCLRRDSFHNVITKHGKYGTDLYYVWNTMKQRCTNPNAKDFKHYGGRGLSVCQDWLKYEVFEDWALSNGYQKGLSIERLDNNKGYSPDNCSWIPLKDQMKNTRNSLVNRNN